MANANNKEIIALLIGENYDRRINKVYYSGGQDGVPQEGMFHKRKRKMVVPKEYDGVEQITESLFWVEKDGKCGIFNTQTGEVTWKE
jgi:hypothetical protein